MKPSILKRAAILLIEYIICLVIAYGLWALPYVWFFGRAIDPVTLALGFLWLHLGPVSLLQYDSFLFLAFIIIGIHIVCILAYLIRANIVTAIISFLGIAAWFFLGVIGTLMGV